MRFHTWGLSGSITTANPEQAEFGEARLWHWINLFDAACNRFRSDSEISLLNSVQGQPVAISDTLALCVEAALSSAEMTNGLCDPTVLPALLALGYDRDFDEITRSSILSPAPIQPCPGIQAIEFDRSNQTITLAEGCRIDLGASAKALVADLVANDVAIFGGVVVEIGGDVAVRGEGPNGPWVIGVSDSLAISGREPRIAFSGGGIATSSMQVRTWRAGDQMVNHIIDPRTGACADGSIVTATVSASNCVIANAFSTAALLWGEEAGFHIAQAGWSGRLVHHDGSVEFVGGWPEEEKVA